MRQITVIGSVNVDLVVRATTLPRPGETVIGGRFLRASGGKGANQAAAAAAMGARVRFQGCVGRDEHGRMARAALRERGIDVRGLANVDAPTGVAVILVDENGQNMIAVASGANALARPRGRHDIAVCQLETPWELPQAKLVILNPAPAHPVPLEGVDWVIPNELEAEQLTGERSPERAHAALLAMGARHALVTLGPRGVYDGLAHHAAFRLDAVDTTGAGDAFVGAFAAALAEDHPDPLRFAQAAAALKVTRLGAQNLPSRSEVESLLARAR
jgi:ribokinase